ncbi:Acetyltransferase (GNAT) domain-containing protein [Noviherbaspirillum humi]|uniref:Acetyltransferase (GNAT) domain-containing protein n=1 Tax=Noviherbaspirillum humi TaxID=1688639 RepID=A0A239JMQ8_9BURK|nr:GNAT family N-acetyltransferase [Noviherbaspirillum humi]SNT07105.1 Acetyltransferase (GNAT) domain-containing protein [Noviherbaspirillum humi]
MQIHRFAPGGALPSARDRVGQTDTAEGDLTFTCYENQVPPWMEPDLIRLYGSLYASHANFSAYNAPDSASLFVARRAGLVVSALMYRRQGRRIQVLNEVTHIGRQEMALFARHMFARHPEARQIGFRAISTDPEGPDLPQLRLFYTENIVISLPDTKEAYIGSLGKSTRKNIKHHISRAKRAFPSFEHVVVEGAQADEADVRAIIDYNHQRMAGKNKVSSLDEEEAARLLQLVRACGLVSLIRIEGAVRAGAIYFRIGDRFFSVVNAHDPAYDNYRLGMSCCYLTVLDAIHRGATEFHLLWGRYEYKYALLGVQRDLEQVVLYRSSLAMIAELPSAFALAWSSYGKRFRFWFIEQKKHDTALGRLLRGARRQPAAKSARAA